MVPVKTEQRSTWLIDQHFIGDAFKDTLFFEDNEKREKACSWKIMSSIVHCSALASGMWRWKAIGIPLNLFDSSLQGDIDLLIAMLPGPVMQDGRRIFPPPVYRCFELKTAKISRDGGVKSLKRGKFHKVKGQLEKLWDLGSQQVFLLEAFIVEAGYSYKERQRMPPAVREAISAKYDEITDASYGYVAMAIEQIPGFNESATGIQWPTVTIKSAKTKEPSGPILEIISAVESYAETSGARGYGAVITYCYSCRKLTHTQRSGPYICPECKTSFI